ncbi:hypothetical protein [Calidithermus timidus]|uniref:hypothetical protein n=1 Tax=Calidithermus timidus TaxID=307124 RepID=UPI000378884B|nr:hypothetical protein [Calidithermus timidus]
MPRIFDIHLELLSSLWETLKPSHQADLRGWSQLEDLMGEGRLEAQRSRVRRVG